MLGLGETLGSPWPPLAICLLHQDLLTAIGVADGFCTEAEERNTTLAAENQKLKEQKDNTEKHDRSAFPLSKSNKERIRRQKVTQDRLLTPYYQPSSSPLVSKSDLSPDVPLHSATEEFDWTNASDVRVNSMIRGTLNR
jgi:hypothetical protein